MLAVILFDNTEIFTLGTDGKKTFDVHDAYLVQMTLFK